MSLNFKTLTLSELGWTPFFMQQLDLDEFETLPPARISEVRRDVLVALTTDGPTTLTTAPDMPTTGFAVGDWVVATQDLRVVRVLERNTSMHRKAAGHTARSQLIAANIDVLFITTSCNADFNPARLERYLVMAAGAGCLPVLVLTKADQEDPQPYIDAGARLQRDLPVVALNAKDPGAVAGLLEWWKPGQTAALLGSSGVGKSTLTKALCAAVSPQHPGYTSAPATAEIREDDARGRHTTTTRNLYAAEGGRWIVDTPGMRELQLLDTGAGIDTVFADLEALATQCKFRNCAHAGDSGCAIQAAIVTGDIEESRFLRWQKLSREEALNTESVHEARSRGKTMARYHKRSQDAARHRKGNRGDLE